MFGGEGRPRTCPLPSGQGVKHRVVMRRHRGVRRPTGRALSWRELLVLTSRFCLKQGVESHLGTGTSSPTGCRVPSSIIPHKRASCATFITLKMFTFKVFLLLTGNLFQPDGDDHRSAKRKEKQVPRSSSAELTLQWLMKRMTWERPPPHFARLFCPQGLPAPLIGSPSPHLKNPSALLPRLGLGCSHTHLPGQAPQVFLG